MKNLIQQEYEASRDKMFKDFKYGNKTLVKLTRDNVAIAEAMIRNDSAYRKSTDDKAAPIKAKNGIDYKYGGSSAYWMTQLKKYLNKTDDCQYSYERIIKDAVTSVDRENSTHLNSDGRGRKEIIERLIAIEPSELKECLKNPAHEDLKLIREISRITSAEKRARKNLSFASKFCHYACFYVFKDTKYQDNYSIWDSIIRKVLPLYLDYYNVLGKFDLNDYSDYRKAIDAVIQAAGGKISRNGFDHLLWYYHKGRL